MASVLTICGVTVVAHSSVCNEDFGQRTRMTGSFPPDSLNGVHGGAWRTRRCGEYRSQPGRVKRVRLRHGGGCKRRVGGSELEGRGGDKITICENALKRARA